MRSERSVNLYAATIFLVFMGSAFPPPARPGPSTTVEIRPAPPPASAREEPQDAKTEAQSGSWKVTVGAIKKVPKQPLEPEMEELPENKFDTLDVRLEVSYTGAGGNVQAPAVSIVDAKGHKFESVSASLVIPEGVSVDESDPELHKILSWISHVEPADKKNTHALKGGERFTLIYSFQDPKDYENLKLVFNDVPPITLKVP
jgi:hypothetical protein